MEPDYNEQTVDELKAELDKRGLEAPGDALKADLIKLLEAHDRMGEHAPTAPPVPDPEDDEDRLHVPSHAERKAEQEAEGDVRQQLIDAADRERREKDTTVDWDKYPNKER